MEFNNRAWITENEAKALLRYASQVEGEVVEIGTFRGGGTEIICQSVSEATIIWSIDLYVHPLCFDSREIYHHYYLKDYENVFLVTGDSSSVGSVWNRSIDFLVIDASHDYVSVKADFEVWSQWVKPGGILWFHDAAPIDRVFKSMFENHRVKSTEGVKKLVNEEVINMPEWEYIESIDTVMVFKKL